MAEIQPSENIALVTGGNKGIGREVVRQLAAAGMTVYLGARHADRGRQAAQELAGSGSDVRFLQLDVTDQNQVDGAALRIRDECGRLDLLVNNAGIVVEWGVPISDVTAALVRAAYETNVFGVVAVTQACLPLLRCSADPRIVNVSSPLGSLAFLSDQKNPISTRHLLPYSSSKAALNAITVLYANALREEGVRVDAVSPGLVATDLNARSPFSRGVLTPEQGAAVVVGLARGDAEGPAGAFHSHDGSSWQTLPW
ncbi:SDR family NAD(P)-dependent oxidoreductase [Parafrankia sp. FMc2]|uniref:SDR family NAD(P)-dependent oxidoreductase n=1 Tax=Parafrankia sp. FMc2 TaxID=3233196 RepID=UPI0034D6099A